jgi:hypothetical protein
VSQAWDDAADPKILNYGGETPADPAARVRQMQARANAMFGAFNAATQREKQQWLADQEQRAIANDINRSKPLMYPVSGR